jgi:hypothetical protein
MPRNYFMAILVFLMLYAAWVVANPPSGAPGTTFGGLIGASNGFIGIKIATPLTLLDVNGTTTIRKSLDVTNNRIINVAKPVGTNDAVTKAYADAQTANMASSTMRLWGEGRPGASVLNALGECTSTISSATVKISRSSNTATWDGSRAACPANWWVCSASERGSSACGSGNQPILTCDPANASNNELYYLTGSAAYLRDNWAWTADTATTSDTMAKSATIASGANTAERYACNIAPVWCCSY